ncbi:MAG: hypothetical protein KJ047_11245 [Anaerolineae bacterium]|nr:hypothetical protein [Anaerolineae bacterium]
MRARWVSLVVLLGLALTLAYVPQAGQVRAAGEQWLVIDRISSGCLSGQTGFEVAFRNLTPGEVYYADTIVKDFAGVVYMDEYFSATAPGPFDNDWSIFNRNDRGLQTGSFPMPENQVLILVVTLRDKHQQALWTTEVRFTCNADDFDVTSIAGCDQYMPITASSVVGTFVLDTPLYWAPGELVQPYTTVPAGKTAWVLGMDATGAYYKIVWVCDVLYVPRGTMGPNFDAVWGGRALPTTNAK